MNNNLVVTSKKNLNDEVIMKTKIILLIIILLFSSHYSQSKYSQTVTTDTLLIGEFIGPINYISDLDFKLNNDTIYFISRLDQNIYKLAGDVVNYESYYQAVNEFSDYSDRFYGFAFNPLNNYESFFLSGGDIVDILEVSYTNTDSLIQPIFFTNTNKSDDLCVQGNMLLKVDEWDDKVVKISLNDNTVVDVYEIYSYKNYSDEQFRGIAASEENIWLAFTSEFSSSPNSQILKFDNNFNLLTRYNLPESISPSGLAWNYNDSSLYLSSDRLYNYSSNGIYKLIFGIAPTADFTASVETGSAPLSVTFTDQSQNSPDEWYWDFGDGSNSTEQNPTHTYTEKGEYTVSLTVSNDYGEDTLEKENFIIVSDPNPNAGLVAYYPFNGNANDDSGNDNHGTVNGAELTSDRFGNENSAYYFDGRAKIEIDHTSSQTFYKNLTIAAWINPQSSGEQQFIFSKWGGTNSNESFYIALDAGRQPFGKINFTSTLEIVLKSDNPISLNEWYFVAMTYDGVSAKLYVNGEVVKEIADSRTILSGTLPLVIGDDNGNNLEFNGYIDDCYLYNATLTEGDILELFNVDLTDIKSNDTNIPTTYTLQQNYPNPFNPSTKITYDIKEAGNVRIELYNTLGQKIKVLLNENQSAGSHEVTLNASDLTSGVYFYQLTTDSFVETKKMTLLK